jgi:hypothetical protein
MKKILFVCSTIMASLLSQYSIATADLQNVTITTLNINRAVGSYLFIRTSVPPTVVGCQLSPDWNLVLPLDSELNNKIYSALLAAQVSQTKVTLQGAGACTLGVELINNITILKP